MPNPSSLTPPSTQRRSTAPSEETVAVKSSALFQNGSSRAMPTPSPLNWDMKPIAPQTKTPLSVTTTSSA